MTGVLVHAARETGAVRGTNGHPDVHPQHTVHEEQLQFVLLGSIRVYL